MGCLTVILLFSFLGVTYPAPWTYEDESRWPGACEQGQQQSPINIISRNTVADPHGAHIRGHIVFNEYKTALLTSRNTGHTLQWNQVIGVPGPSITGGPLRGTYNFVQFHLHWLSEHAIDGIKYPLEIHFVHVKNGLNLEQALERPDGLAVVGVMAQVVGGEYYKHVLEEIMVDVPYILNHTEVETPASVVDMTRFISQEPQSYYTYHGSLTTPMCQEAVTWIVMNRPISISDEHYRTISKVNVGGVNNYRSLQPTNRVVYRSASYSSIVRPTNNSLLAGIIACLLTPIPSMIFKALCILFKIKQRLVSDSLQDCVRAIN